MNAAVLLRWKAVFSIYFQDSIAYRASGLIWILTDATTALTMPFVWLSATKSGAIKGFSGGDLVLYYLCNLLVGAFITCWFMFDIAFEIKEGQFSSTLVRPFSFFQLCFIRNLSWRVMRLTLTVPFFLFFLWLYREPLTGAQVHLGPELFASVILGHLVSFTTAMALAMVALYVGEAMGIFELYFFPQVFLSGAIVPISLLPDWARAIGQVLPFYYTTGLPTEIMIGRVTAEQAWPLIGVQALWAVAGYGLWRALYKNGLKHYTGVGM